MPASPTVGTMMDELAAILRAGHYGPTVTVTKQLTDGYLAYAGHMPDTRREYDLGNMRLYMGGPGGGGQTFYSIVAPSAEEAVADLLAVVKRQLDADQRMGKDKKPPSHE